LSAKYYRSSTLPGLVSLSSRFSTNPNVDQDDSPPKKRHPQSFVQSDIELELGELETSLPPDFHTTYHRRQRGHPKDRPENDGRDAYWRPPWRNPRAEIVSAQDFANRPRVTFSENFASMHDAMAVLSWMGQEDKNGMYKLYVDMMTSLAGSSGKKKNASSGKEGEEGNGEKDKDVTDKDWGILTTHTSHEYVIRVVAQRYNVTTSRAAGVIQLQHNEEQLKKDPTFKVNHALQAHVDETIRENHREVYASYGEKDPLQFVEDPVASTGILGREDMGSPVFEKASELTDVDALLAKTRRKEIERARRRIANRVYVEDVDERTRKVKVDKEARRLLKKGKELATFYEDIEKKIGAVDAEEEEADGDKEEEAKEPDTKRLYVGNLSKETTEADVRAKFEKFGKVTECVIPSYLEKTPHLKNFAFVTMPFAAAEEASKAINGKELKGNKLKVNDAHSKEANSATKKTKGRNRTKVPLNLKIPSAALPYPENNRGHEEQPNTRRKRWKYVAQIINTHALENPPNQARHGKRVAARAKGRRHGRIVDGNTIIEENGTLRVASVAELEKTSWKHVRNESEFMFRGVKEAWLERQLEGEVGGWGVQEEVYVPEEETKVESEAEDEGEEGSEENEDDVKE